MSLIQRAAYAGQSPLTIHNEGLAQILEMLRNRVSEIIPSVEAARLISLNPRQARSE